MKKRFTKILVILCCMAVLATAFSVVATAAEKIGLTFTPAGNGTPPLITGYNWYPLGKAISTQQTANYFIINTTAGEYKEQLYISLPAEGGFRLQSVHQLYQDGVTVSNVGLFEPSSIATIDYKKDASGAVIMTGSDGTILRYVAYAEGFELQVLNKKNKKLVGISNEQISFAYKATTNEVVRTMVELPITTDGKEVIYQGGERYNDTNQVGYYTSLTNGDCWSNDEFGYVNVPIFHSNRGYTVWFNMTYSGEADMGANDPSKYQLRFDGDKLDFYMWTGTPLENLKKYTSITGTSGMYNEWVFGFWSGAMSSAFNNTRKKNAYENLIDLVEGYMDNYGFYPESLYGEGQNSQYARNIQYQKERGIKTTYWYHPAVSKAEYESYQPGKSVLPVKDPNGQYTGPDGNKYSQTGYPWIFVSQPLALQGVYQHLVTSWIDYSNPSSKAVFPGEFHDIWEWGVHGAMIDYGENLSFKGTCWNGLSGMEMHNFNSYYYAKYAAEAFQEYHNGDYVLYERSGCAGSQYFVGNFLGDQRATWIGFCDQIYSMISLGASGYNLYGGDFCSLGGKVTNNLMSRWMVLSTFSPWMRQHGGNIHMPWEQGEANAQNFGKWYYFRQNIVPTVMSAAIDANKTSNPIIKGMLLAYPYQLSLSQVNNQYLFCDDFLVCHVTTADQHTLDVHLPNGSTWYSLFTYEKFEGNQKLTVEAPTAWSPVFVKAGAVKAIDLPESMILADEMHDMEDMEWEEGEDPHDSLLITPPDAERTSTIHIMDGDVEDFRTYDSHTEVYTNKPVDNSTFTLTADNMANGSDRTTILALGVTAKSVTVDGEELDWYDHMPDYFQEEYGYYVEAAGLTTIYVPAGWKEITIVKGDANYTPIPLYGEVNAMDRMFDGKPDTYYQLPTVNGASVDFYVDGDEAVEVDRILLKWTTGFWSDYDVEYTEDGETWNLVTEYADDANTVIDGAGSFDLIQFEEGTKAVGFRITKVEAGDTAASPALYEFNVYKPTDFAGMGVDDSELPEYPEDGDDWFEDDWDEDEGDDADGKTKRKKKIIYYGFPWWAIALMIGGGVILATGILLLILLLLKKKKKKEAEAALEAAEAPPIEESPTDFPNPAE